MSSSCAAKCGEEKESTCGSRPAVAAREKLNIDKALSRIRHKILVMSGKGGVGKSTVAVNLAVGLADKGFKVGLMDVDLHGPDICRMLNLTETPGSSAEGRITPLAAGERLRVMSLENMMENRDDPIIWRGPLKNQAIRRFIADVEWGDLDYLVIDAPPGTGDEPMTVAQTIKDAKALVVTTPQQVALADVRKSINFCGHVGLQIIGLVENMSGFVCPHCGKTAELFKSGGGEQLAAASNLPFLGRIPLDPRVMLAGDDGSPFLSGGGKSPAVIAMNELVARVNAALPVAAAPLSLASAPVAGGCGCGGKCDPNLCDC